MYSLPYQPKKNAMLIISYSEVVAMLESVIGKEKPEQNKELDSILEVLVFSYFSSLDKNIQMPKSVRVIDMLSDNMFVNFEHSALGFDVNMAIVNITRQYLPGFDASNLADCRCIKNLEMFNRHQLRMELDAASLLRFTERKPFYAT